MVIAATGFPCTNPIFFVTQLIRASTFCYSKTQAKWKIWQTITVHEDEYLKKEKKKKKIPGFQNIHVDVQCKISSCYQILHQTFLPVRHSELPPARTTHFRFTKQKEGSGLFIEWNIERMRSKDYPFSSFMLFHFMVTIFQLLLRKWHCFVRNAHFWRMDVT